MKNKIMLSRSFLLLLSLISPLLITPSVNVYADSSSIPKVICSKNSTGALSLKPKCRTGETKISTRSELVGAQGVPGAAGISGTDGADGALRAYGNGSDGDVTFSTTTILDPQKQYHNITIDSGVTAQPFINMTIRCTGTFTNNGSISMQANNLGGESRAPSATTMDAARSSPSIGSSLLAAQNGEIGTAANTVSGGLHGRGLTPTQAAGLLKPSSNGGGGGGGSGLSGIGGSGKGSLTILCKDGIVNSASGIILANGVDGTTAGQAGGGGGLVILASEVSITNAGTIIAGGGRGVVGDSSNGSGGGGSGGIVHFIAPIVNDTGTLTLGGGVGGVALSAGTVTATIRAGGGGGGALAGNGGNGGDVLADGSGTLGVTGDDGIAITTNTDPLALLF